MTAPAKLPTCLITCPDCSRISLEPMPPDACLYFYQCRSCGVILNPLPGDCCVFCSYGDCHCPERQGPVSGTH